MKHIKQTEGKEIYMKANKKCEAKINQFFPFEAKNVFFSFEMRKVKQNDAKNLFGSKIKQKEAKK
jgi:hypothetical protein